MHGVKRFTAIVFCQLNRSKLTEKINDFRENLDVKSILALAHSLKTIKNIAGKDGSKITRTHPIVK